MKHVLLVFLFVYVSLCFILQNEYHLTDVQQLTFGGQNAEAYWSPDGKWLTYQSTHGSYKCDQIFRMNLDDPANITLVSTGLGRTTCSYWTNDQKSIIYSSTHTTMGPDCPPPPDKSKGYVWALYPYEIFQTNVETGDLIQLTNSPNTYDAEATICRVDGSILFTSTRDVDLELYRMNADGTGVKRLTFVPGYDGGAYFSDDCTKIVWRASRPTGKDLQDYYAYLRQDLVSPLHLDIWVANSDGSEAVQVTHLNDASFAPYFFPGSTTRIIFASNYNETNFAFNLWAVNVDGSDLERITDTSFFNSFPMFSPDGSKLAFCSARNATSKSELNAFVAKWVK